MTNYLIGFANISNQDIVGSTNVINVKVHKIICDTLVGQIQKINKSYHC